MYTWGGGGGGGGGGGESAIQKILFTKMSAMPGDFPLLRGSLGTSHMIFCAKIRLIASPSSSSSGDSTGATSSLPMPIITVNLKCNN